MSQRERFHFGHWLYEAIVKLDLYPGQFADSLGIPPWRMYTLIGAKAPWPIDEDADRLALALRIKRGEIRRQLRRARRVRWDEYNVARRPTRSSLFAPHISLRPSGKQFKHPIQPADQTPPSPKSPRRQ